MIGALDGSHIHAAPPAKYRGAFQNRKGFVSQNCLFACSFNLQFTYSLTGWEGSATDARVYQDAREKDLHIEKGKYFLADSGYPHRPELLVPYQNTRYHLAEWRHAALRYVLLNYTIMDTNDCTNRPNNKEKLFNLRHASARNVIKRIFGVLKRHFWILLLAPEYSMEIQACLPVALASIHNFIQIHDSDEAQTVKLDNANEHGGVGTGGSDSLDCEDGVEADGGLHEAQIFHDNIAELMWNDYQQILRDRENTEEDPDDVDAEME